MSGKKDGMYVCGSASICPFNKGKGIESANCIRYDQITGMYYCNSLREVLKKIETGSEIANKYGLWNGLPTDEHYGCEKIIQLNNQQHQNEMLDKLLSKK